jgi:hypothetical protein
MKTTAQAAAARIVLADTAREIRNRFRASRKSVPNSLDLVVARRRGLKTADGIATLAGTMLDGGYTSTEAVAVLGALSAQIVEMEAARRRAA